MTIPAETHAFLLALYRRSSGYLTLSALPPDRDCPTPSRHLRLNHVVGLESGVRAVLRANRHGWGAVFSVATGWAIWGAGGAAGVMICTSFRRCLRTSTVRRGRHCHAYTTVIRRRQRLC